MPIRPAHFYRRNGYSFPRIAGSGQAHRLGISKPCRVFELWLHGICNCREGVATTCSCSLAATRDWAYSGEEPCSRTLFKRSPPSVFRNGPWILERTDLHLCQNLYMLHSDIIPDHECSGQLIDVSESRYVTKSWCSKCGTEFSYEPDSIWVTIVYPGMKSEIPI